MGIEVGFFGLILLAANIYAIVKIIGSGASTLAKVLWVLAILIFPFVGFVARLIFGPSSSSTSYA